MQPGKYPHRSSKLQWFDWEVKRFVDVWVQSDMGSLCCFTTSSPIFSRLVCKPLYFKHVSAFYPSKNALLARKSGHSCDKDYVFAFETSRYGVDFVTYRVDTCRVDFQIFRCNTKLNYSHWMAHFDSVPKLVEVKKYMCSSFPDAMVLHKLDATENKKKCEKLKSTETRLVHKCAHILHSDRRSPSPDPPRPGTPKTRSRKGTPSDKPLKSPKEPYFSTTKTPACYLRTLSENHTERPACSSGQRKPSPSRGGPLPPGAFANSCCLLLEAELREKSESARKIEKCLYHRIEDLEVQLRRKDAELEVGQVGCDDCVKCECEVQVGGGEDLVRVACEQQFAEEKKAWVACMEEEVKKQWEKVNKSVVEKDKLIAQQQARIEELERVMSLSPCPSVKSVVDTYVKCQLTPGKQEKLMELDEQLDFILEDANELSEDTNATGCINTSMDQPVAV